AVYDLGCVAGMLAGVDIARRQERLPGSLDLLESRKRGKAHTERKAKGRLSSRKRPAAALGGGKKRKNTGESKRGAIKDAPDLRRRLINEARPGERARSAWDVAGRLHEARKKVGLPKPSRRRIYELTLPALKS